MVESAALRFIKGDLRVVEEIAGHQPDSLQARVIRLPARLDQLIRVDRWLASLFQRWGLIDDTWCDAVNISIIELMTNLVQHCPKPSADFPVPKMHLTCLIWQADGARYFFAITSGDANEVPIPIENLHEEMPELMATRGRGTAMIREFTDLFAIAEGTDCCVIMKRVPS